MKHIALSTQPMTGALRCYKDSFVAIGDGLEVMLPPDVKVGDSWDIVVEPYTTAQPLTSTLQGDELFITSNVELLSSIRGNLVVSQNDTSLVVALPERTPHVIPNFRSNMLASFFNHLFIVKDRRLSWTDLDNPWEWLPHPHNEADSRIIEWESDHSTGLVRAGDKLWMHFPTAIYEVSYVGKPTVVSIQARIHGIGAVTPRSLTVHSTVQFFLGLDNFYAFSSDSGLQPIGTDIWRKFVATRGCVDEIWSYVDHRNNEICWVTNNTIWAFNFLEKIWTKHSADGITDQTTSFWSNAIPMEQATTATIINPDKFDGVENLWVLPDAICREARGSDTLDWCVPMQTPYLESDDFTYGDLHFVKRCDLVVLDARYDWPWVGVNVEVNTRDFVTQVKDFEWVGLWDQTDPARQTDFRAAAGKVLKFRFSLADGLLQDGMLFDGTFSLDGAVTLRDATTSFGFFELNAWGERVDLPQTLVGPDK